MRTPLRRDFAVLFLSAALTSCSVTDCDPTPPTEVGISADTVFWQAVTAPERFDAWLATQTVQRSAAGCLHRRDDTFFGLLRLPPREERRQRHIAHRVQARRYVQHLGDRVDHD